MKSQIEKVSTLGRKLNIEVPAEVVKNTFEKMFQGIQRQADIKGFRKGKAPLATIKSLYGDRVKQDVAQELIQKHYSQAINEHNLEPINWPEFEFDSLNESQNFSFSASFEIRPEITLKKYEGLEVEKEKSAFDESKVTQVLENIRAARAALVPVLENRPAQLGDVAVIDFDGTVNGAALEGGSGKEHHLELGSGQFIEGFEQGIVGMKVGESKTINLKFPDPYHSADLAGKPVDFKVTLTLLKKKDLPELNDEFIKTLGGPADLESLKNTIRDDLQQSETKRIENDFKNRMLKKLVSENPTEVPTSLLNEQKAALVADFEKRMTEQGMTPNDFEEYKKRWDADFSKTAAEMVQAGFLIDTIAKKHDLDCTAADIEARLEQYAKQTGIELTRIQEFYGKPEQRNRLAYQITEEKVMELLTKTAKIKEVDASQLKDKTQAN